MSNGRCLFQCVICQEWKFLEKQKFRDLTEAEFEMEDGRRKILPCICEICIQDCEADDEYEEEE